MQNNRLRKILTDSNVNFEIIQCTPHMTTRDLAAETHVSIKGLAKTVPVKIDGKVALLVEPRHIRTDLEKWQRAISCKNIEYALETDLQDILGELDRDSIPAFDMFEINDVYVDDQMAASSQIAFGAGTEHEIIKMNYADYVKWVKPKLFHVH